MAVDYFSKKIISAFRGKRLWKEIRLNWGHCDDLLVVMLPEKDGDFNKEVISQLPEFMERKFFNKVCLILPESENDYLAGERSETISIIALDDEKISLLSAYYQLHWFYDDFIYASARMPYGNTDVNLLGSGKITMGELVKASILC